MAKKTFTADFKAFVTDIQFDAIVCWFALFHIHASHHHVREFGEACG